MRQKKHQTRQFMDIQTASVKNLFLYLPKIGIDVNALLKEAEITEAELESGDGYIAGSKMLKFLQALERANTNNLLGLEIGGNLNPPVSGILGHYVQSIGTLREALLLIAQYHKLFDKGLEMSIEVNDEYFCLQMDEPEWRKISLYIRRQLVELYFAWLPNLLTFLSGEKIVPAFVHFEWDIAGSLSGYRKYLGENLTFDTFKNVIAFHAEDLEKSVILKNDFVANLFQKICKARLAELQTDNSFSFQVKKLIYEELSNSRGCTAESVADAFHLGLRTFQRKLKEEKNSFRTVYDEIRKEIAIEAVQDASYSLFDIAEKLGFQDEKSFKRAFQDWTDLPLNEFLDKNKDKG